MSKKNIFYIRREIQYRMLIYNNLSRAVFGATLINIKISEVWQRKQVAKMYRKLWKEVKNCN